MTGHVTLVGAGPGDAGLLTLRGLRALQEADVIVADRLGARAVLQQLAEEGVEITAEVIDVGKLPGHHPVPQDGVNELLVEQARAGRRVVRLKGGDPFVFGRGREEQLFCEEHGVSVDVVPGVTSVYRWEGAIHEDRESTLLIKTRASLLDELTAAIREVHPYAVPEVIALPIETGVGNPAYLAWVRDETRST